MSSTERAPEPTMEEILASIRRIISDDETNTAQQRAKSSEYAEQVRAEDTDEEAADTQMIDHLARALGGSATPTAANDDDIDDILDLTESGGSALEDVMLADEPASVVEDVVFESDSYVETRPTIDFAAAFPQQEQSAPDMTPSYQPASPFTEDTPSYEFAASDSEAAPVYEATPSYAEEPPVVVEIPSPEPVMAAQAVPSLDDPTTALERAIAALKAGDLAAFAREAQADYAAPEPAYVAPELAYVAPETVFATPQPEPEALADDTYAKPKPENDEPEPAMAVVEQEEAVIFLAEPEAETDSSISSWSAETASWSQIVEPSPKPEPQPETDPQPGPEPAPWRNEEFSWGRTAPANEFELNPGRINGSSSHERHDFAGPVSSKSLEDSVKEMLRPLLKQWLDENMPRVLTAALREELEGSDYQRPGS